MRRIWLGREIVAAGLPPLIHLNIIHLTIIQQKDSNAVLFTGRGETWFRGERGGQGV